MFAFNGYPWSIRLIEIANRTKYLKRNDPQEQGSQFLDETRFLNLESVWQHLYLSHFKTLLMELI